MSICTALLRSSGILLASCSALHRPTLTCRIELPERGLINVPADSVGHRREFGGIDVVVARLNGASGLGSDGRHFMGMEGSPVFKNGELFGSVQILYGDGEPGLIGIVPIEQFEALWNHVPSQAGQGGALNSDSAVDGLEPGACVALLATLDHSMELGDFGCVIERRGNRLLCSIPATGLVGRAQGPTRLALARAQAVGFGKKGEKLWRIAKVDAVVGSCVYDGASGCICVLGMVPPLMSVRIEITGRVDAQFEGSVVVGSTEVTKARVRDYISRQLIAADMRGAGNATLTVQRNSVEIGRADCEALPGAWLHREITAELDRALATGLLNLNDTILVRIDVPKT